MRESGGLRRELTFTGRNTERSSCLLFREEVLNPPAFTWQELYAGGLRGIIQRERNKENRIFFEKYKIDQEVGIAYSLFFSIKFSVCIKCERKFRRKLLAVNTQLKISKKVGLEKKG